jgi:hypothetical protein
MEFKLHNRVEDVDYQKVLMPTVEMCFAAGRAGHRYRYLWWEQFTNRIRPYYAYTRLTQIVEIQILIIRWKCSIITKPDNICVTEISYTLKKILIHLAEIIYLSE